MWMGESEGEGEGKVKCNDKYGSSSILMLISYRYGKCNENDLNLCEDKWESFPHSNICEACCESLGNCISNFIVFETLQL